MKIVGRKNSKFNKWFLSEFPGCNITRQELLSHDRMGTSYTHYYKMYRAYKLGLSEGKNEKVR